MKVTLEFKKQVSSEECLKRVVEVEVPDIPEHEGWKLSNYRISNYTTLNVDSFSPPNKLVRKNDYIFIARTVKNQKYDFNCVPITSGEASMFLKGSNPINIGKTVLYGVLEKSCTYEAWDSFMKRRHNELTDRVVSVNPT